MTKHPFPIASGPLLLCVAGADARVDAAALACGLLRAFTQAGVQVRVVDVTSLDAGRRRTGASVAQLVRRIEGNTNAGTLTIVVGQGGLLAPLNSRETLLDLWEALDAPVLLTAHNNSQSSGNGNAAVQQTLLTLEAARGRGLDVAAVALTGCASQPGEGADAVAQSIPADLCRAIAKMGRVRHVVALPDFNECPTGDVSALAPLARVLMQSLRGRPATLSPQSLLELDRQHIWHPYTCAVAPLPVWEAVRTQGSHIYLRGGQRLVDGMASWWAAIHGYNHPRLLAALRRQSARMPHVMFGGLTHAPAVALARQMLELAPAGLEHVFFADSGSVAVEVALKMAVQYHVAAGQPQKAAIMTLRGGYHGDTLGAMSVCDPHTGMHTKFARVLPQQIFADRPTQPFHASYAPAAKDAAGTPGAPAADAPDAPNGPNTLHDLDAPHDFAALEHLFVQRAHEAAAFILEPIVQGAGGMWLYHPAYLRRIKELCDAHNVLLIADEIATGFGRTGKMFACEWAGIAPDILCVGKALTGGVMSLAATLASRKVAHGIARDGGVLMHGPTFMGNPLACAVASASLELLTESPWQARIARIERALCEGLTPCRSLPGVADVRVLGAIGVVEMQRPVNMPKIQEFFVRNGVWIRPFGKLIYVMPAYTMPMQDVARLTHAITKAVRQGVWE